MRRLSTTTGSELTDVTPLLGCFDIAAEHDFLVDVLGFASAGVECTPASLGVKPC